MQYKNIRQILQQRLLLNRNLLIALLTLIIINPLLLYVLTERLINTTKIFNLYRQTVEGLCSFNLCCTFRILALDDTTGCSSIDAMNNVLEWGRLQCSFYFVKEAI